MSPQNETLAFFDWIWHKTAVPVWLERFALAILASAFLGIVILNSMKMDGVQRLGIGVLILGLSIYVAQTIHLHNLEKQAQPTTAPMPVATLTPIPVPSPKTAPKKRARALPIASTAIRLVPFTVQHLDSGNAELPDEMRVTLQPKAPIQPIHLIVRCKEDFGNIHYGFVMPSGLNGVLDGINPRPKEYEFSITYPPMTPDNPLVISILSRTRNEVIEIERR